MSELLAGIYSRSDAFKRRLVDALRNPVDAARQKIGSIADGAREANRLTEAAALEQDRGGPANMALNDYLAERVNPLAMVAWHGSPRLFNQFSLDAPKTTGGAFNKYGVSISEEPSVATRYAKDFGKDGGFVYKVDAKTKNQLGLDARDFHKLQSLTEAFDRHKGALPESSAIDLELLFQKYGVPYQFGQHPIDAIKGAQFDSIRGAGYPTRAGRAEQETLVFDPGLLDILEVNGQPVVDALRRKGK